VRIPGEVARESAMMSEVDPDRETAGAAS
jgi:hypothetical protein